MKRVKTTKTFLSCEHASHSIPKAYQDLFKKHEKVLLTHEGWDMGALEFFQPLKRALKCEGVRAYTSRLLIDLNRSLTHPRVFSRWTKALTQAQKQAIIEAYYVPYRTKAIQSMEALIKAGSRVRHFSIHSFTPVLNGERRNADIGLLYDPSRPLEQALAKNIAESLHAINPHWRLRMNYPYRGTSDGFTTAMRKHFKQDDYLGLEIELNQGLTTQPKAQKVLFSDLIKALKHVAQA